MENSTHYKVLVIGIDGATFDWLGPWLKAGQLPNLQRLIDSGASGTLMATVPPISPSAWVSFATGKNPGKHGVVDFVLPRPDSYEVSIVNSTSRTSKAIWNLVSDAGLKVGVVGVPVTYPPEEVNGFMVSDFLTPAADSNYTYPRSLKAELEEQIGGFLLLPDERYRSTRHVGRFVADLRASVENRTRAVRHLLHHKEWDFFCAVYWSPDMLQHDTWRLLDPSHPQHDAALAARYRDDIIGFYVYLDECLGQVLAGVDAETLVMVMSDHGFGPSHYFFLVNNWLHSLGLLHFKANPVTQVKRALFRLGFTPLNAFRLTRALGLGYLRRKFRYQRGSRLIKRLFLSFADVDWNHTRAYAVGSFGQIYINTSGRRPQGIVQPGQEYEELRDLIIREALALRNPLTGEPIVERAYRREEVYHGPHADRTPDVILQTEGFRYLAFGHADFGSHRLVEPIFGMSGHHRPEGILILAGPGIRPGSRLTDASILDLAPTILYGLGLPIPADMDGRLLTEAFAPEYLASRPPVTGEELGEPTPLTQGLNQEEEQVIVERLKQLGYLG